MLNYTSEDFAADYPTISVKKAARLCREHGTDLEEYFSDHGGTVAGPVNTRDLLDWLGY